jgi:hypothetical protein
MKQNIITVIDSSDHVGWFASAVRIGEVYMTDVPSMVSAVIQKAGKIPIDRLNILDHGNEDGIQIGEDWIDEEKLPSFRDTLYKLNGKFSGNGFVHLQHCKAGNNFKLLGELAGIFGVPVYAGTGLHNPVYRFNTGVYVKCPPPAGVAACMEINHRP